MNEKSYLPNFILIDYENVQPMNLQLLSQEHFRVHLFLGALQTRIPLDLAEAMHSLGPDRAKYIRVTQSGANALDFHITYFLGKLVSEHPSAHFHVVSRDKGYDPLIEYLDSQNIKIHRRETIANIPILSIQKNSDIDDKYKAVVENLIGRGSSRPRRELSLKNTMKNTFKEDLTDTEINKIFAKLVKSKQIRIDGVKISYGLSKDTASQPTSH